MLPLLLFAASLLPSQQASMECVDTGATIATTATQPVLGPGDASAVLKVSTADDHSKNSHECWAEYKLEFTAAGGKPLEADVDTSDGDYGRNLTLRLAGFSRDGKHVFGLLSEGGKYAITLLFDYHAGDAVAQLVDLRMQFAGIAPRGCAQTLSVIGTTRSGAIVMESNSDKACGASRRWMLASDTGKPQRLATGASILSLYEFKTGAP